MYCFDTSIVVDILRNDKRVVNKINSLVGDSDIFITSITLCELYKGAYGHANTQEKIKIIEEFLESVYMLDLDKKSSKCFGEFWQELRKKGNTINDFDVLIASIVKSENLILITRDDHFKSLGIKSVVV